MLNLFLYKRRLGAPDSKLLRLLLSENEFEGKLFQEVAVEPFKHLVNFVDSVSEADYILLPHEYYFIKNDPAYIKAVNSFVNQNNKKIIVIDYGDLVEQVNIVNAVVLRTAGYRETLRENEIIIPPFIEDLGEKFDVITINHKNKKPVVGFVGMVNLPNLKMEIKYQLRMVLHKAQVLLKLSKKAQRQGLFFRRLCITILSKSDKVTPNFLIRKSFSADRNTIIGDKDVLRREYIDSIKESDLNLIVRGDGNYSLRFFEVLSLGKVPLFIDTDTPLPLENDVAYDEYMLRVDYSKIGRLNEYIDDFWRALSEEEYGEMQVRARNLFETKLRPDVFYKNLFEDLKKNAVTEL